MTRAEFLELFALASEVYLDEPEGTEQEKRAIRAMDLIEQELGQLERPDK